MWNGPNRLAGPEGEQAMTVLDWHAERSDLTDLALLDRAPESGGIDLPAVRRYRQARVRAEMTKRGIAAVVLMDPVNIRYATGTRNMQVFSQRNGPARYLLLTEHRSVLFEFTGCEHLAAGYETVDQGASRAHRELCRGRARHRRARARLGKSNGG